MRGLAFSSHKDFTDESSRKEQPEEGEGEPGGNKTPEAKSGEKSRKKSTVS